MAEVKLWRVWNTNKRWKLVEARDEQRALQRVRHSVKAVPVKTKARAA